MLLPRSAFSLLCKLTTIQIIAARTAMDSRLLDSAKASIPDLNGHSHKGQAGRIGIIGGSLEYTGAPYFAGISALKVGADLVHIFCASSAATVIKSYSPELIVHPLLDHQNATKEIVPWFDRLHAIVIGPGLGRNPKIFEVVSELIKVAKEKKIPLVIDADGLFLISDKTELIKDYPSPGVILTPNKIEYERLCSKFDVSDNGIIDMSKLGEFVTILRKGKMDEFYSTATDWQWDSGNGGSGRRCGGQGDLLSGSIATFLHWTLIKFNITARGTESNILRSQEAASVASYAASRLVRLCNEKAFKIKGRSMLASDMLDHIHDAFEELFGQ